MFNENLALQIKGMAKTSGSTIQSVVEAAVKFALDHGFDVTAADLPKALRRGRRPGSKVTPSVEAPVGAEDPS